MNILFFTKQAALYGANKSLFTMIVGLQDEGHSAVVVTSVKGQLNRVLNEMDIPNFVLPFKPWYYTSDESFFLKKVRNKIVQSYKCTSANYKVARNCKEIIDRHNIQLIYSNSSTSHIGYIVSKMYKLPHIWHIREFLGLHFNFKWSFGEYLSRKMIQTADKVITVSQTLKDHHCRVVGDKPIQVIYDGVVSVDHFEDNAGLRALEKRDTKYFVFAIIGSISKSKGQMQALLALAEVKKSLLNARLLIIGKGDRTVLEEKASELNMTEDIEFTGHVNNVFDHYHRFDVLLVCSQREGFGMVTVEAMAGRKPVIVRDDGGPSEIVEDGKTGLKYQESYKDLAKKMIEIAKDDINRQYMLRNAFEYSKQFSLEKFQNKVCRVLKDLNGKL